MNFRKIFLCIVLNFFNIGLYDATHRVMSYQDYTKIKHDIPYVYRFANQNQILFYFGANHSCDPENKQYPLLQQEFSDFLEITKGKNCIVLVEGSLRGVAQTKHEAITEQGGEGGLITLLAHQANIACMCPEPQDEYLHTELLKTFSHDEILYRHFAQICLQFNRYKEGTHLSITFERFHNGYCKKFHFADLDTMKKIHATLFHTAFNPNDKQFFYDITNPVDDATVINLICRQESILRDQYIVATISKLLAQDKNIFIVYGATHAVMQESAIHSCMVESALINRPK